ncbi:MAG: hypothetical protein II708_05120, partial [Paludibacteraceae bacterium]|nr:hypothetical protein [Paludibacteraceae bacterium]
LTIYYLATGGDFLESFKNGKVIYRDDKNYLDRVRDYLLKLNRKKMKLEHDKSSRMILIN